MFVGPFHGTYFMSPLVPTFWKICELLALAFEARSLRFSSILWKKKPVCKKCKMSKFVVGVIFSSSITIIIRRLVIVDYFHTTRLCCPNRSLN